MELEFIMNNDKKNIMKCAWLYCMYMCVVDVKLFMKSIYTTKYHWNVKPDSMMLIAMSVHPL